MMKRVPRLGTGTFFFSQPVARTLTSFCLHFGQTSSRLQSQWDLSGQRRHLLYVACRSSKSVEVGGGRGGGGKRRVALKDLSAQQVMSAEGKCMDSPGSLLNPSRDPMRCERTHFKPGPKHFCLILLIYVLSQDHM